MTPYEQHQTLGHRTGRYSPNGIGIIVECEDCPARFLFLADDPIPSTMPVTRRWFDQWQRQRELAAILAKPLDEQRINKP